MLPVPDISQGYVDTKTGLATKPFYNWLKSIESGGSGNWAIFVGQLSPPVLPNGQDQTANLQAAIDRYTATGATLQFGAGTYIFNSAIILKPNIILRGMGIDITTLKVGVDNISLIDRWGSVGADAGVAGVENLTAWGYADRNGYTQNTSKLVSLGPFNYYWIRGVKAYYSANMGLAGIGGIGIVDSCVVSKSLRDAINLTGTKYVQITNNDISECGDDAIAFHTSSAATGINDCSARITGNRIQKSFGIKCLGVRNATIEANTLRFWYGYGVFVGISGGEGNITKFGINIVGNSMLDGLNGTNVGAGSIGYGIFITGGADLGTGGTAIPVNVGQYYAGGQYIQKPDVFINKAGAAQPKAQDGNISITGNTFKQTISGITNFSDAGFGSLFNNAGPIDPAISTLLGDIDGIRTFTDLENTSISGNTFHGVGDGIRTQSGLNNINISNNTIFRITGNGISLINSTLLNGSIVIANNVIDCDPYLESPIRTVPIDGTWTANDGSASMCIWIQNCNGVSVNGNRLRNCIRPVKGAGSGNWVSTDNVVEFDWSGASNRGIALPVGLTPRTDIFWFCNSDPTSVTFNQYEQDFLLASGSQPASGYFYHGTFVQNTNPGLDANNMSISGWLRRTDGNTHVAGTDWIAARVSHVSPAV